MYLNAFPKNDCQKIFTTAYLIIFYELALLCHTSSKHSIFSLAVKSNFITKIRMKITCTSVISPFIINRSAHLTHCVLMDSIITLYNDIKRINDRGKQWYCFSCYDNKVFNICVHQYWYVSCIILSVSLMKVDTFHMRPTIMGYGK